MNHHLGNLLPPTAASPASTPPSKGKNRGALRILETEKVRSCAECAILRDPEGVS
uniref:Uncharacterized protein n=1 Tax=Arundo donax TaxID=35708 RepID=A0A0A9HHZ7_ARUDO